MHVCTHLSLFALVSRAFLGRYAKKYASYCIITCVLTWLRRLRLEPATSGLSLRAALRCPKNRSGFRFSSDFSTAAVIAPSLHLPPAAGGRNSQRAPLVGLITREYSRSRFRNKKRKHRRMAVFLFLVRV